MDINVLPLLSAIANGNNAGVSALRDSSRGTLHSFDKAFSRFQGALGEIRFALHPQNRDCCQGRKVRADTLLSSSIPILTELQCDIPKNERTLCTSRIASRPPSTPSHGQRQSRNKDLRSHNTAFTSEQTSLPPPSPRPEGSFEVNRTMDRSVASFKPDESPTQLPVNQCGKIGFIHKEAITIDLMEMREVATSIMSLRILSTSTRGVLCPCECGECMLRDCLIKLSVIIAYNLGLAHHLNWRKQRLCCDSPKQLAIHSPSLLASLGKAQVLYSVASRNMIGLPSLKNKLVLLNNLGQVYWELNRRELARKCFEVVCRQVTKSLYECSGRNLLIPLSTAPTGTNAHTPQQGDKELMRSLMIAATRRLLPDPHAAVA